MDLITPIRPYFFFNSVVTGPFICMAPKTDFFLQSIAVVDRNSKLHENMARKNSQNIKFLRTF